MIKGRVYVFEDRCKGCTLCTTACPQGGLAMAEGRLNARGYHPVEFRNDPARCTGCGLCATICPDAALMVFRDAPVRRRAAV